MDAAGNYITRYDSALLSKLLAGDYVDPAERMTLLNDLTLLISAGGIRHNPHFLSLGHCDC